MTKTTKSDSIVIKGKITRMIYVSYYIFKKGKKTKKKLRLIQEEHEIRITHINEEQVSNSICHYCKV